MKVAGLATFFLASLVLSELWTWEHRRALDTDRVKLKRVESEGTKNCRRDLGGLYGCIHHQGTHSWVGQQQHGVGVIVREATVLLLL